MVWMDTNIMRGRKHAHYIGTLEEYGQILGRGKRG
jgi:hypothetical protein